MRYLDLHGVCVFDDKNERVLSGLSTTNETMTVEMCIWICGSNGYQFAGLEWQIECHCGNEPAKGFKWAWPNKCNDRCPGNHNQVCGGSDALSIYSVPEKDMDGICVYDHPNRILDGHSDLEVEDLTVQKCQRICSGVDIKNSSS